MMQSQEIIDFIKEHENDNIRTLALQSGRYPHLDMHHIIEQIAGRQIAKNKIPTWYENDNIIYPKHISLEQCSSQKTAEYKASLCEGSAFVDLTGGMGVDFFFMAQKFKSAVYVEQNEELAKLGKQNFLSLNLNNSTVLKQDSVEYLRAMPDADTIYIDPARRSETGKKTVLIEDCTPNLIEIQDLLNQKAKKVIIKLSPMLDISLALKSLTSISSVHIISVDNECKELLFVKEKGSKTTDFHCINIQGNSESIFTFSKTDKQVTVYANNISNYLYEPNASIMKAGAYQYIDSAFGVEKLHANSHLYTSDGLITNFPGRKFHVNSIFSLNKKDIREHLSPIEQANITVRNFPLTVADLRKKLKIKDGGNSYLFATTTVDEKKVLILCEKAES